MCGFAGKLSPSPQAPVDRALIRAMGDSVAHRGPDADGFYFGEGIGLAHRRLSIVDVATGQQPLANEDDTVWVVFNGEIYNFPALRAELESRGHRFRTHSDTEVIVHGYEEWGDACVERFRGMFAFAIWDTRARRLLLARDRVGIKPVYYAQPAEGGLVFGSEIKSILQDPAVDRAWSPEALDAYLTLLYVPAPATIYRTSAEAARRPCARGRPIRGAHYQVLGSRVHWQWRSEQRGAVSRGAGWASDRVRADAAHQRSAARRVSLRRHRFHDRCRLHDGDERRRSPCVLGGLCRQGAQRARQGASDCQTIWVAASKPRWWRPASKSSCLASRGTSTSRSAIPRRFRPTGSPPPRASA